MGEFSTISDIVKNILTSLLCEKWSNFNEQREINSFLEELYNWCNDYILKKEATVITGSAFCNYITHYNLIENIVYFVSNPIAQSETSFLESCYNNAIDYLNETYSLSSEDKESVKEFIYTVFTKIRDFYRSRVSVENKDIQYTTNQNYVLLKEMSGKIEQLAPPKSPILKKHYSMPENTIIRKIALFKDIQEGFLFNLHPEDMIEVCLREKHLVLLGEAGCGKSVAISQLASMAGDSGCYPLIYNLNDYTNCTINEIIESDYPEINKKELFLIFDAYDEIEEKDMLGFARKIDEFVKQNPETVIVISSRNNFYRFADDDGDGGLFSGFKEYGLYPISGKEREIYIRDNGVEKEAFFNELSKNGLKELIRTPFYLRELLMMYKQYSCLAKKSEIMEEIIRSRFNYDRKKYVRTKELEDYEREIFLTLEKIAFAIQCLRQVKLCNEDYQELFDIEQRKLVEYSGIFTKSRNGEWSFEHNNFREYLTAKYINRFEISYIKTLMCSSNGKIFNSWTNVLSFLVLIRENDDLLNLLFENSPEMVIRFERTRVDETTRNEIVKIIVDNLAEKNMWLSYDLNSADIIAAFGQSKDTCEYLLSQISAPKNFRALSNALSILSEFSCLYGMDEEIRKVLFNCLNSKKVREYEKCKAMEAIVSLDLDTEEIADNIVKTFNHDMPEHYKKGVLKYLSLSNRYEDHFDLFIEEYKLTEKHSPNSMNIYIVVMDVFVKASRFDNLCKTVATIAQYRNHSSAEETSFETIIENAADSYNCGNAKMFDTMVCALFESIISNSLFSKCIIAFFDKTNTQEEAFLRIAETDLEVKSFEVIAALECFSDVQCYTLLLQKYLNNPKKYETIVRELTDRFDESYPLYPKYMDALCQNGIMLPKKELPFDYDKAYARGHQIFFDSLFDKDQHCMMVEKLTDEIGNKKVTFAELKKEYYSMNYKDKDTFSEQYSIQQLYFWLSSCGCDGIVLDTARKVSNQPWYSIGEIYNTLLHHGDKIIVCDEQKRYIETYCRMQLQEIDFQNEISDTKNGTTFTNRSMMVIFFSTYFNFEYSTNIYLNMLFVSPWFFRSKYNDIPSDGVPLYLTNHLSDSDIKNKIKHNLAEEKLCLDVIDMYIQYCKNNEYDWAITAAEAICSNPDSGSWRKRSAIEYLGIIKGNEYIHDKYLNTDDRELMDCIISVTFNHNNSRLKDRLEELNRSSQDGKDYLTTLIMLNSRHGLRRYYEIAKADMKATDMNDDMCIDSTLDAISDIFDPNLLDELENLRILLFTPGFQDKGDFGLHNSLYKAYQNVANTDFIAVKGHLEDALNHEDISDEEKSFCYSVLSDIEFTHSQQSDVAWTVKQIKEFFASHK